MLSLAPLEPVDYLVLGHITIDQTPKGEVLGGSAAYAALTAQALGLRVGVVTMRGNEIPLRGMEGVTIIAGESPHSTTFENIYTPAGRVQHIRRLAPQVPFSLVP